MEKLFKKISILPRTAAACFVLLSSVATFTSAQLVAFSPPDQNSITYHINIPKSTAETGSGPIYFQMKAPDDVQWLALGEGPGMVGGNIFVIYASGVNSNITISPRLGLGHFEPLYNSAARVTLLEGSGIHGGMITANVRCDSCITWSGGHSEDVTSSTSSWIWAFKKGPPLDSISTSETITKHDISGVEAVDLTRAVGGSSANPFLDSSTAPVTGGGTSVSTANMTGFIDRRRVAHATMMIVAFVILLPSGALTLHVLPSPKTVVYIHAPLQLLALALVVSGFGVGLSLARDLRLTGAYHQIVGYVVVSCLILFQPAMGLLQHLHFRREGTKGPFAYSHRWLGRIMVTVGVINGGLGFHLTRVGTSIAPRGAVIAYGVVAGVMGLIYLSIINLGGRKKLVSSPFHSP